MGPEKIELVVAEDRGATPSRLSIGERISTLLERSVSLGDWGVLLCGVVFVVALAGAIATPLSVIAVALGASAPVLTTVSIFLGLLMTVLSLHVLRLVLLDALSWLLARTRKAKHLIVSLVLLLVLVSSAFGALYTVRWAISVCLR